MNKRELSKLVRAAGRMLLALGFVFSQSAWPAPNQDLKPSEAPASKASAQQAPVKPSPLAPPKAASEEADNAAKQNVSEETTLHGGPHEGIKVHGHWTLEVRNPDGTVVTHRDFENSLTNGATGGASLLATVLGRANTTGNWEIQLQNSPSATSQSGATVLFIDEPTFPGSAETNVFKNLTVANAGGTLTISGSATVPSAFGTVVGYVGTFNYYCPNTTSPSACPSSNSLVSTEDSFTGRALDGQNGDPAAVPVSAGQTVAVTVVISFS
jgi:hypothetical protein